MNIRCLIVDDEPLALDVLEAYIDKIDNLQLVGRLDNAIEAFNLLNREAVDLLFLDIQMPKLTGIELLRNISHPPQVIFTTAYRDYALQGYELDVVDYLLKPISFDRFLRAVNKVYQASGSPLPVMSTAALPQVPVSLPSYEEAFIYLKADKKMIKVLLSDILYIESLKDYVKVRTRDKTVTAYQRISYMEEKLPEDRFMRIHRSFIVALDKVEAYCSPWVEVGSKEIPIGRNYRSEVLKTLNDQNLLKD
jgi:DNA-binding LytR/AlgR family response regulator